MVSMLAVINPIRTVGPDKTRHSFPDIVGFGGVGGGFEVDEGEVKHDAAYVM